MTTTTQTRPVDFGLPGDSGWRCACDCTTHLGDVDCEMLNAPAGGRFCEPCAKAVELGLIKTLGTLIRDAVEYDGKNRDLEHLRTVYALRAGSWPRWIELLSLWITETPSTRAAGGARQILAFHAEYASTPTTASAPAAAKRQMVTEDGMYRNPQTGEIFKVQFNKAQGDGRRLYAKRLVMTVGDREDVGTARTVTEIPLAEGNDWFVWDTQFKYAEGAMRFIDASWKMTIDEAKAFGALYGTCCVCGRTLTDEKSIAAGIGPVCAEKF
jgi:hypothetical protein